MRILATTSLALLLTQMACSSTPPDDQPPPITGDPDDVDPIPEEGRGSEVRKTGTPGWPIALSATNLVAVAANKTAHTVSVFRVDPNANPPALTLKKSFSFPDAEPVTLIIDHRDDDTAFVVLKKAQKVVKINKLHSNDPQLVNQTGITGAEPQGIAMSPRGKRLYVSNWAEGTLTLFNTNNLKLEKTIDLNPLIAQSGALGTVEPRPGLAHPMAVVVTNLHNGTRDNEETLYVTEFFSQQKTGGVPADDSRFDVGREGFVYHLKGDGRPQSNPIIKIAPVEDTGFKDSLGRNTGCFPNQLMSAALNNSRLYITSVCTSPRGPTGPVVTGTVTNVANFKTQVHAAIFAVNIDNGQEIVDERAILTQKFQAFFDASATPDNGASRRIPLIPNNIHFVNGTHDAYVTAYGSDAVFRVRYDENGDPVEVGKPGAAPFINLAPMGQPAGRLPIGLQTDVNGSFMIVLNENTRNVSIVSLATQTVVGAVASADAPREGAETEANIGRRFFVTGLGRWSLRGQAWNSCEACHPQGLTDNVSWFFARGPRQTTALDGTFDSLEPSQQRVLNWSGIFDEIHDFELNTRGNSGGVGAIVHAVSNPAVNADRIIFDGAAVAMGQQATTTPQAGLNGSTRSLMPAGVASPKSALKDWDEIEAYVKLIRAPRGPTNLDAAKVSAGRELFTQGRCAGCHGSSMWTISRVFFDPNEQNNGAMGVLKTQTYTAPAAFPAALNPASAGADRRATLRFTGMNPAANDQINCVLRAVGTFPATLDGTQSGVAAPGVSIREVRQDMSTPAQGATGFNPPSLLGMVTGAPYYHAGNARTLEEAFGSTFDAHANAFAPGFLDAPGATRPQRVSQLVSFLLSIDETTAPLAVPPESAFGFSPLLCPARL